MKRIVIFVFCIFLITGCQTDIDMQKQYYEEYKEKLNHEPVDSINNNECNVQFIVNQIKEDEYRYDIIIDDPKIAMYNIKAICKVKDSDDMNLPSIGLLEKETYSLVPNVVDKPNNIYKGINLSGICQNANPEIILYLTFYLESSKEAKIQERWIVLNEDPS